jgi:hypothetical protein
VQLLVVVLHREELLDDVLSALVELELPDAVVVESRTSLELLERDLPIFAGIRSLIPGGIDFSRLVLCLVERDQLARSALGAIRALGEDEPSDSEPRNTAFLVPVNDVEYF